MSDEKEAGRLQAVKLQFVVLDQAVCKHEEQCCGAGRNVRWREGVK